MPSFRTCARNTANLPQASLRLSLYDAFFFSIMVGAGESYLPAYALSTGMSETLSGFFSSVPMIIGALIQMLTPWAVQRMKSVKKYVVLSVAVQAAAFLPLIYFAIDGVPNFFVLFLIVVVYWGAGFAAGPTWNFWMGHLLSSEASSRYFSTRTRINQIGVLAGLVGGGIALHYGVHVGPFTSVFSLLFLVAFVARASSSIVLSAKFYNPNWFFTGHQSVRTTIAKFWHNKSYRYFFSYVFIFYITVYISAPFVSPFFLAKLELNYFQYMCGLAAIFIAKILILPLAPGLIDRWGIKKVFLIGAFGVSPLPALWAVYREFWFVLVLQAVSGAFWALFEVVLTMVFFQQIKSHEKIPVLTFFNLFNAVALIVGSSIGGQILHAYRESISAYFTIFMVSSSLRVLTCLWFTAKVRNQGQFLS
jgi:MFS family permease